MEMLGHHLCNSRQLPLLRARRPRESPRVQDDPPHAMETDVQPYLLHPDQCQVPECLGLGLGEALGATVYLGARVAAGALGVAPPDAPVAVQVDAGARGRGCRPPVLAPVPVGGVGVFVAVGVGQRGEDDRDALQELSA